MAKLLVVILGCALLYTLLIKPDRWEGYVYPDRNNLDEWVSIGQYADLDSCKNSALLRLQSIGSAGRGDYECGLNCEDSEHIIGMRVCETTRR